MLLAAIVFHGLVISGARGRALYGFLATAAVLYFAHYLVFVRRTNGDVVEILKPVLFFNLLIVVLYYYAGFEFGLVRNDFKVGFTYSNFWDFYYQALTVTEGTFDAINTGYLPASYAISKIFAKLAKWKLGGHEITRTTIFAYCVYLVVFLSPLLLLARQLIAARRFDRETSLFLALFLATCYPVLFAVERGNFVIISFCFLSLMMYFYQRGELRRCAVFAGLLVSLKVLNFLFLLFILRRLRGQLGWFAATVAVATVVSLIALFGFELEKWMMFKTALLSPFGGMIPDAVKQTFVATDGGKLQGMSSIESFRILLRTLIYAVNVNVTTDKPLFNLLMLVVGFGFLVFFYAKRRHQTDWLDEIMVLTAIPMLFHSGAAEYNLILLLAALMLVAAREPSPYNNALLRFASLFLMLSGGIVISLVALGTEPGTSGVFNSATPKSFLVPFSLLAILLTIYSRHRLDRQRTELGG